MTTASESLSSSLPTTRQMMRGRFRDLVRKLRRAARGHCAPGELHELRITCRKIEALLRLNRAADDSRASRWLRRRLRKLRRSCNALRDNDALCKWLAENESNPGPVRRKMLRARRKQLPEFVQRVRRLVGKRRLIRNLRKILRRSKSSHQFAGANAIFGTAVFREVARFVGCLPTSTVDELHLHRLRIAGKRLRYQVEVINEIAPTVDLAELTEFLGSVQKQSGAILDQLIREQKIDNIAQRDCNKLGETADLRGSIDAFSRWLKAQPLDRILADVTAEIVMWIRVGHMEEK